MPASPIAKKVDILPDNWAQLQKTMIPDSTTSSYWSVWYNAEGDAKYTTKATAWLMWCPVDEDPSVNDSWGHAEEIGEECKDVLTAIESVYGVSFHDSIWVKMEATEVFPARAAK